MKFKKIIKNNKDSLTVGLIAFLSRVTIVLFGVIMSIVLNGNLGSENFYKAWIQWDGGWYMTIINDGYQSDYPEVSPAECVPNQDACQRNFAFFPAYPMTVKTISNLTSINPQFVGIVFSNICFILAAIFLYKLVKLKYNVKLAKIVTLVMIFFPTSYVFSALMTEGLFLFLLILTAYFTEKKNWILAGISAGILSGTRIVGILSLGFLILRYLESINFKINLKRIDLRFLLGLLIAPTGILLYMLFLNSHVGDPLAFAKIQSYWSRSGLELNPFLFIYKIIFDYSPDGSIFTHIYNLGILVFIISSGIYGYIKKILPLSYLFILSWIFVPIIPGTSLVGLGRYMSPLFPIYIVVGSIIYKYKKSELVIIPLFTLFLISLIYFYVIGSGITI